MLFPKTLPRVWTKEDWETEYAVASAFKRPVRSNLNDTPFYPWVPRNPKYCVSFKLGFVPQ